MKKSVIALLLVLTLALGLVGCGTKDKKESKDNSASSIFEKMEDMKTGEYNINV